MSKFGVGIAAGLALSATMKTASAQDSSLQVIPICPQDKITVSIMVPFPLDLIKKHVELPQVSDLPAEGLGMLSVSCIGSDEIHFTEENVCLTIGASPTLNHVENPAQEVPRKKIMVCVPQ